MTGMTRDDYDDCEDKGLLRITRMTRDDKDDYR